MNDATTTLLTEHLSYTPLSLIDDIINSINNLIYQAISSLEASLLATPPERLGFAHADNGSTIPDTDDDGKVVYPEAKLEIENGLHQLETLLEATVDKAFDKFEIYVLRNILTVPADLLVWVRLKHYEHLVLGDALASAPTPESILALRKKLDETRKLNRCLRQEAARNEAIISQLRSMLASPAPTEDERPGPSPDLDLAFLTANPAARQLHVGAAVGPNKQHTPLTTNTAFVLSQLPALQSMLKRLRPKLESLATSPQPPAADWKTDARRAYIESRIKLHLERAGQLALARETHTLQAGRRIDMAEARALESINALI